MGVFLDSFCLSKGGSDGPRGVKNSSGCTSPLILLAYGGNPPER